jgi:hypothetical protein
MEGIEACMTISILYLEEQVKRQRTIQKNSFFPALKGMKKALTSRFLQLYKVWSCCSWGQKRFCHGLKPWAHSRYKTTANGATKLLRKKMRIQSPADFVLRSLI